MDDVLTFVLLAIGVSGGDFKSDCFKWFNKAVRLTYELRMNAEDENASASARTWPWPSDRESREPDQSSLRDVEAKEERRRVFWLLYALDRHLALSFNTALSIPDSMCQVFGE